MPPKKSQHKTQNTSKKCNSNNRGYCKSEKECSNKHSDVVCDTLECEEETCDKRHPYQCKYGMYCRFNKKKECLYSHVTLASEDDKLDALNKDYNKKLRGGVKIEKRENLGQCPHRGCSDPERKEKNGVETRSREGCRV